MFLACVIAFIAGIYIEAVSPVNLIVAIAISGVLVLVLPFLIARMPRAAVTVIPACFLLVGMARLGFVTQAPPPPEPDEIPGIYECLVTDKTANSAVVSVLNPAKLRGARALFRTPGAIDINDRVRIFGEMRNLTLTFKNPYTISWKWVKSLEGVNYEVKGTLLSVNPGQNSIQALRRFLKTRIEESGARYAAVIKALTIGDTTGLDEDIKTLFLHTGTSHILAISGSNIGIVCGFFFFLCRMLLGRWTVLRLRGDDTRYAALLTIPFAFAFMAIAGSGIPLVRATIMITVFMLSLFIQRGKDLMNTLALSALIILLIYPHSLFTPSFQLTFMSVLFIALATEKIYPLISSSRKAFRWVLSSVLLTVSATLGTLPFVVYHFYGFNPFSFLHNLVAVPLMCVLAMPIALAGLILPFGAYLLKIAGECIALAVWILSKLDVGFIYPVVRPNLLEGLLYFLLLLSLLFLGKKLAAAFLVVILIPAIVVYGYLVYQGRFSNDTFHLHVIDVGLGEALLVEAPGGIRMLMDGGGSYRGDFDIGKSVLTPVLLSRRILTLDYMVSTHPHGDHAGGLLSILKTFTVKKLATSGYFMREANFIELLKTAKGRGVPIEVWHRGESVPLAATTALQVLHPGEGFRTGDTNDASLVIRVVHGKNSFLLTGDIGREVEERLVLSDMSLQARVLKVPHHGSKNSSTAAFLRAVHPDCALMSVGPGIKGLPGAEALERYRQLAIPLLRTDRDGYMEVVSDGRDIRIKNYSGLPAW